MVKARRIWSGAYDRLVPWVVPMALMALWQLVASVGWISTRVAPAPSAVVEAAFRLARSGELFDDMGVSFARAAVGFAIGGTIGLALGLLNGLSPAASRALDSTLQMVRNVPHLALIPLVILWFGIGEEAKIFLVAFGAFFPVYLNTYHGVRTVDPDLLEMARVYGLTRVELFRQVIFPGALSSILVGIRYALGFTWLTLIVAETIAATSGIGYMTMNARDFLQTDVVVLGILIYALLGKLADVATVAIERHCLKWHPAFQTKEAA
jgi:sulfonate transport system permease protein